VLSAGDPLNQDEQRPRGRFIPRLSVRCWILLVPFRKKRPTITGTTRTHGDARELRAEDNSHATERSTLKPICAGARGAQQSTPGAKVGALTRHTCRARAIRQNGKATSEMHSPPRRSNSRVFQVNYTKCD